MKDEYMKWFRDAKYGLFIHFGLYTITEGEYNGVTTPFNAEWIMNHINIPLEEYVKLAGKFNPVKFDAEDIVLRAKAWGMRYIVFTAKHHEGFALYHSKCSPFNVVDATPFKRDILKELQLACEKHKMPLGLYYSQAQDWHDPDGLAYHRDNAGKDFRAYLERKCKPQLRELLTEYGDIAILWFDTQLTMTKEESRECRDIVKELQPNCIINGRLGNFLGDYKTTSDNLIPLLPYEGAWEIPATLNNTWSYKKADQNWKDPNEIIRKLIKIVGRGGNYLLNIGPYPDGSIPEPSVDILDAVAEYVNANAEAIFETKLMPAFPYDTEWFMLTAKDYKLYINVLQVPPRMHIVTIRNKIKRAYIVHTKEEVPFVQQLSCENEGYWEFELPDSVKGKKHFTLCVETEEKCPIFEPIFSNA
ncbi:MAG: alpha-L-fucosidase [Oscillospiraceae bacterium]|nr:alpha-L-fucosidase [Oscillospiraceae bacterium]